MRSLDAPSKATGEATCDHKVRCCQIMPRSRDLLPRASPSQAHFRSCPRKRTRRWLMITVLRIDPKPIRLVGANRRLIYVQNHRLIYVNGFRAYAANRCCA
jgi:hypothetical protein